MFENQCNQSDTQGWEVRLMLFNAMVVLLYGVQVWGDKISLSAWDIIAKIEKVFLRRQLGVKSSTSYPTMRLETSDWPIERLAMQRVYKYITRVNDMLDHRLSKQARNIGCKVQKTNKSKIL